MGNEVQVQKTAGGLTFKLPPHLAEKMKLLGISGGNLGNGGVGVNQLLIESKKWTANVGGEKKTFTRPVIIQNDDGTYGPDPSGAREPVPTLNVIVMEPGLRGRIFYDGPYAENNRRGPDCWSEDGKKASPSIEKPVFSGSCDMCPKAAKGSAATTAHPEAVACGYYKRLAVQVCSQRGIEWGIPPLSLKLSISSIWDMRDELSMAEGWYAWDNYVKFLRANGCAHSAAVITQMRFNPNATLQVQFKLIGFTELADYEKLTEMAATDEVRKLLPVISGTLTPRSIEPPKGKPLPKDDDEYSPQLKADIAEEEKRLREDAEEQAEKARQFEELKAAAEAEAKKEAAAAVKRAEAAAKKAAKAEAEAKAAAKAEAEAKAAAEKVAAEAIAKAQAQAAAEDGAWDEPKPINAAVAALPANVVETAMPERKKAADVTVGPAAVVEVPASLTGILGAWGE